jgi:hypothetical protein
VNLSLLRLYYRKLPGKSWRFPKPFATNVVHGDVVQQHPSKSTAAEQVFEGA